METNKATRVKAPRKGEPGYKEYMRKKLLNKVIKAIKANPQTVFTCQDAFLTAKVTKAMFYDYFKEGSDELNAIKEELSHNKFGIVKTAVNGLMNKKETTAYIAVIKMYGSEEQRAALSHQDVKISGNREQPLTMEISMPELKVAKRERKE